MKTRSGKAHRITPVLALALLALVSTGCGTMTGGAVGAGAGAAIGAGTGYGAGKGALIGAGVGVAAGAIYDITKHEK
jgi:Glycine zipper